MTNPGLAALLYQYFREVGFDYDAYRSVEPRPLTWLRPPLLTGLELGGVPLMPFLAVRSSLATDELVDIYERFISGYIYTRQVSKRSRQARLHRRVARATHVPSDLWLGDALGLNPYVTRGLFIRPAPGAERLGLHLNLVQFGAFVAQNHACHLEHDERSFVAITQREGLQFGVRDSFLVSQHHSAPRRRKLIVRGLVNIGGRLVDLPRGEPDTERIPTLYGALRTWVERESPRLGALAAPLLLGVTIMRWRSPYNPPGMLRLLTTYERSTRALAEACAQARHYAEFDQPVATLKEIFVPHFVTLQAFAELFGNPYQRVAMPLSARIRQKWDQAINSLDPGYQGDDFGNTETSQGARAAQAGAAGDFATHPQRYDDREGRSLGEESLHLR